MRFLIVLIGMFIGAIVGIWLSVSLFPNASPGGPMLLGGLLSFGSGCWAYLGLRTPQGLRPDTNDEKTWLVLLVIALGVVAIHLLLLIGAYAVAQR